MKVNARLAAVALAAIVASCGGDDKEALHTSLGAKRAEAARALEVLAGVYEITYFTWNVESCEVEGRDVLEISERLFVVFPRDHFRVLAQLAMCESIEDCLAMKKTAGRFASGLVYKFSEADMGKLGGRMVRPGYINTDDSWAFSCIDAFDGIATLAADGEGVRFEQRGYTFHHDGSPDCSAKVAKEYAAGKACNELVVIRGRRVADLE